MLFYSKPRPYTARKIHSGGHSGRQQILTNTILTSPANPLTFRLHKSPLGDLGVYSLLKLSTGFAIAAFIAWKLTVMMVIKIVIRAANTKTPMPILIR